MNKCLICGKENIAVFANLDGYSIRKCSNCGFGFTENTKLQTGEYHRDDQYVQEEELFRNIFQKRVDIITGLVKPGKALEVGCSTGLLLSLLKKAGWDVIGIEPSKQAAHVATKRGINVVIGTFEDARLTDKFDLVILNHVLEHVENPELVMEKSFKILNPKGVVLISLPNFDSLSAKIQKGNWPLLLPSEHLWHFTPTSLKFLLNKFGFTVFFEEESSGIWDLGNPLYGLWKSFISFKKRFFTELFTAIPDFIISKLKAGSGIIMLARKN